ncbi:AbrB family transcriptional regulator [Aneurinibacillus migulanus]|uniref:AbrB/MazE/SpoVT family DNA-binding domain-containing protein n=1 Tax=Aneurinibacillus migulanus TaxID=47500 RepID=UPI0005BC6034|nr:AbrB/MazE/SpoVT family DNA-binding domain-containing protein [Aneurinibacillus migulanus]KIV58117.1 AbrB family transcriptional regulator [Aneurinibacillus migulanus]KPD05463.1 AbrB family transcriptional regulator [Aneurinibacillus migulanus]
MRATGIVRQVDELGRIVLPMELRRMFGIEQKDGLEIFVDEDMVVLKKYAPACLFCHSMDDLKQFEGKKVCRSCIEKMNDLVDA